MKKNPIKQIFKKLNEQFLPKQIDFFMEDVELFRNREVISLNEPVRNNATFAQPSSPAQPLFKASALPSKIIFDDLATLLAELESASDYTKSSYSAPAVKNDQIGRSRFAKTTPTFTPQVTPATNNAEIAAGLIRNPAPNTNIENATIEPKKPAEDKSSPSTKTMPELSEVEQLLTDLNAGYFEKLHNQAPEPLTPPAPAERVSKRLINLFNKAMMNDPEKFYDFALEAAAGFDSKNKEMIKFFSENPYLLVTAALHDKQAAKVIFRRIPPDNIFTHDQIVEMHNKHKKEASLWTMHGGYIQQLYNLPIEPKKAAEDKANPSTKTIDTNKITASSRTRYKRDVFISKEAHTNLNKLFNESSHCTNWSLKEDLFSAQGPHWNVVDTHNNVRFTVSVSEMATSESNIETFKIMLECYKAINPSTLPTMTAANRESEQLWKQAINDIYGPALSADKTVNITIDPTQSKIIQPKDEKNIIDKKENDNENDDRSSHRLH